MDRKIKFFCIKLIKRISALHRFRFLLFFIVVFLVQSTILSAVPTLTYESSSTSSFNFAPRGADNVPVYAFKLSTSVASDQLNVTQIQIKNISDIPFGSSNIYKVSIYSDVDRDGSIDSTDIKVGERTFSSPRAGSNTQTIELSQAVTVTGDKGGSNFIIAYSVSQSAPLEKQSHIMLSRVIAGSSTLDLENESATKLVSHPIQNKVYITGIKELTIENVAPSVVLPGQKGIPFLKINITLSGENSINGEAIGEPDSLIFSLDNSNQNFVTTTSGTDGVTNAYFYKSIQPLFVLDNEGVPLKTMSAGSFASSRNLSFTFPDYPVLFKSILPGQKTQFYVVLDIGKDTVVSSETQVSLQLSSINGVGRSSGFPITWPPSTSALYPKASAYVAGLSLSQIEALSYPSTNFGTSNTIPLLRFTLRANHTPISIETITILNNGNTPFNTDESGSQDVIRVNLYYDSNGDNDLDFLADKLVGSVDLGKENPITKIKNQANQVVIPLDAPFSIPQFDSQVDSTLGYPHNNDRSFFVVYHTGKVLSRAAPSVNAQVGNINAKASLKSGAGVEITESIGLNGYSNANPASSTPAATVALRQTTAILKSTQDISPSKVLQGQKKVPMLALTLYSNGRVASANIQIFNEDRNFLPTNEGVSRVWLYRDDNKNLKFDNEDTFITSSTNFVNNNVANLQSVSFEEGDNHLLVLYDFGYLATSSSSSQINNVIREVLSSETYTDNLLLGGILPSPQRPASASTEKRILKQFKFNELLLAVNPNVTSNIAFVLQNTSKESIKIDEAYPKVYKNDLGGNDISYEFTYEAKRTFPLTIPAESSSSIHFDIKHSYPVSSGAAILDGIIVFSSELGTTSIERYNSTNGSVSGSSNPITLSLSQSGTLYNWQLPAHVEKISVIKGTSSEKTFQNYDALNNTDKLRIQLRGNGKYIDEATFNISRGTTRLTLSSQEGSGFFKYSNSGAITIHDVGNTDNTISILVNDKDGNPLPSINLSYFVSNVISLERALFYPNPYKIGDEDLKLGFTITEPAQINIQFYNQLGTLVHSHDRRITTGGYHNIVFDLYSSFLTPGIYICRISATSVSTGDTITKITKLAIH